MRPFYRLAIPWPPRARGDKGLINEDALQQTGALGHAPFYEHGEGALIDSLSLSAQHLSMRCRPCAKVKSRGFSRQRLPVIKIQKIEFQTLRKSARGMPFILNFGFSIKKNSSMISYCASFKAIKVITFPQKWLCLIHRSTLKQFTKIDTCLKSVCSRTKITRNFRKV